MQLLDEVCRSDDPISFVRFLAKCQDEKGWSFGAGIGPVDRDWLQVRAVQAIYMDVPGLRRGEAMIQQLPKGVQWTAAEQKWSQRLMIASNDEQALRKLLKHEQPAIRLLGLLKLTAASNDVITRLGEDLRDIADHDAYVIVELRTSESSQGPSPSSREARLVAPLREQGRKVLGMKGASDISSMAEAAVSRFGRMCHSHSERCDDILEAVKLLRGIDAEAIRNMAQKRRLDASATDAERAMLSEIAALPPR
jgi:uncharacterized protein with von Willebrand factor type A (vWA) domain